MKIGQLFEMEAPLFEMEAGDLFEMEARRLFEMEAKQMFLDGGWTVV